MKTLGFVKQKIKRTIVVTLGAIGCDQYVRSAPPVTELAHPAEAIYAQSDIVFEVPVELCVSSYHFSYHPEGWHPFVDTLRQCRRDPQTTFETSHLRTYYERHCPESLWDVLFQGDSTGLDAVESQLKTLGTDAYLAPHPWDNRLFSLRGEGRLAPSHGVQAHGPVSVEKGEWEFSRLLAVYRSIEKKGYKPTRHKDGEIRGYFLRLGKEYRFFIRAGLHRMATLSALGYPSIRVKFKAHFPRVVDLADMDEWPLVRSGLIDRPIAERIFRRYFIDNGIAKARSLGLRSGVAGTGEPARNRASSAARNGVGEGVLEVGTVLPAAKGRSSGR